MPPTDSTDRAVVPDETASHMGGRLIVWCGFYSFSADESADQVDEARTENVDVENDEPFRAFQSISLKKQIAYRWCQCWLRLESNAAKV